MTIVRMAFPALAAMLFTVPAVAAPDQHAEIHAAADSYEVKCRVGDSNACVSGGDLLMRELATIPAERQATRLYRIACHQRVAEGCLGLAKMPYRDPKRLPEDAALADYPLGIETIGALYDKACRYGSAEACEEDARIKAGEGPDQAEYERRVAAANARKKRFDDALASLAKMRFAEALPGLQQSCRDQIALACHSLAALYRRGEGVEADPEWAAELGEMACLLDPQLSLSCVAAADWLSAPERSYDEQMRAVPVLTGLCVTYSTAACLDEAETVDALLAFPCEGDACNSPQHLANSTFLAYRAASALEKGCLMRDSEACFRAARRHVEKDAPSTYDMQQADLFLEQACMQEHPQACATYTGLAEAGLLYAPRSNLERVLRCIDRDDGDDCAIVGQDYYRDASNWLELRRAAKFLERGCYPGWVTACTDLAEIYASPDYPLADPIKSFTAYRQACDFGSPDGCWQSARQLFEGSEGADADATEGLALYEKLCGEDNKYQGQSCYRAAILHGTGQGTAEDDAKALDYLWRTLEAPDYSLDTEERDEARALAEALEAALGYDGNYRTLRE